MSEKNATLASALAEVQAKLPEIRKGETATVQTKTGGSYKYSYADLADVSQVILPLLGQHGLSWITRPTMLDGRFVLVYELLHSSGETRVGEYPLPDRGTPQEIGSAITYARRYALCAVTGVAPAADDDDGQAATAQAQRDRWEDARPATPTPAEVRSRIAQAGQAKGMDREAIAADFESWSQGVRIGTTDDVRLLSDYLTHLTTAVAA
jgi:hypothetical protein